jgi:hypothetical protein
VSQLETGVDNLQSTRAKLCIADGDQLQMMFGERSAWLSYSRHFYKDSSRSQVAKTERVCMLTTSIVRPFPLAIASLLSGIVQSLRTPWALFQRYWVLTKLLLTTFATIVQLAKRLVCPACFVPVSKRHTGTRRAYGTR